MARKGKKKKNKAKNYSQKKFKNIICSSCNLCSSGNKADFCYSSMYKANPEIFISKVYPNLMDISEWRRNFSHTSTDLSPTNFSFAFCQTGVCTNGEGRTATMCPSYSSCYDSFKKQMVGEESPIIAVYKKKKSKNKARKVYDPYPTFFSRGGEKFEKSIRKILSGDNYIKQDTDKESASRDQGSTDRNSKGGKSEISGSSQQG